MKMLTAFAAFGFCALLYSVCKIILAIIRRNEIMNDPYDFRDMLIRKDVNKSSRVKAFLINIAYYSIMCLYILLTPFVLPISIADYIFSSLVRNTLDERREHCLTQLLNLTYMNAKESHDYLGIKYDPSNRNTFITHDLWEEWKHKLNHDLYINMPPIYSETLCKILIKNKYDDINGIDGDEQATNIHIKLQDN